VTEDGEGGLRFQSSVESRAWRERGNIEACVSSNKRKAGACDEPGRRGVRKTAEVVCRDGRKDGRGLSIQAVFWGLGKAGKLTPT